MASAGEVVDQIQVASEHLDQSRAALRGAAMFAEAAVSTLAAALDGTEHSSATQALDGFVCAWEKIAEIIDMLEVGENLIQDFLSRVGVPAFVSNCTSVQVSEQRDKRASKSQLSRPRSGTLTPEQVERLRVLLPPSVTPGTGARARGWWVGSDGGVHEEISGKQGATWEAANRYFSRMPRRPRTETHVEIKIAAYMRERNIRSVTLVINHIPCDGGPFSCDQLIAQILPAGFSLTVYGAHGFVRCYQGGAIT